MTVIQICALITIVIALAILYWIGYRGGLTDGLAQGYDEGHAQAFIEGMGEGESAGSTALEQISERCRRLQSILDHQPLDRPSECELINAPEKHIEPGFAPAHAPTKPQAKERKNVDQLLLQRQGCRGQTQGNSTGKRSRPG